MTGLKELAFLRDLAEQNSVKYGVPDRIALPVIKGSMMVLNQLSNLETTVGRFYTNLPNRMIDEAVFSLPFSDEMGDGECLEKPETEWGKTEVIFPASVYTGFIPDLQAGVFRSALKATAKWIPLCRDHT